MKLASTMLVSVDAVQPGAPPACGTAAVT